MTPSGPQHWLEGLLDILTEAVEGGAPGQGTAFLDNTRPDGGGNAGVLATLAALSAEQASQDIGGTSVAGQARHMALHLEVAVRWERNGDRGPFDWKGSFLPAEVDEAQWRAVQERVRLAYTELLEFSRSRLDQAPDGDLTGGLAGAAAHVAYHLGAVRQMVKGLGAAS